MTMPLKDRDGNPLRVGQRVALVGTIKFIPEFGTALTIDADQTEPMIAGQRYYIRADELRIVEDAPDPAA